MPGRCGLFRAHVVRRPQHGSGHTHAKIVVTSGQAKVGQPDVVLILEQIGRFHIAMNHVPLMSMRQRSGDLGSPFGNRFRIPNNFFVGTPLSQAWPIDQLHSEKIGVVLHAGRINGHDVLVPQGGDQFGFSFEALGGLLARYRIPQHLQRYLAFE